jgi:hypothetical protein
VGPDAAILFIRLQNPVTPWVLLALAGAGWIALYLFASGTDRR